MCGEFKSRYTSVKRLIALSFFLFRCGKRLSISNLALSVRFSRQSSQNLHNEEKSKRTPNNLSRALHARSNTRHPLLLRPPRVTHPTPSPLYKTRASSISHSHNQLQMQPGSRTRQTVKFATAAGIGTSLLVISGLLLTGTVIALVMATPVLVIFSPILVPAAAVVLLAVSGLVVSGGFGVAAVSALAWIYNYVAGKHPVGADRLDMARSRLVQKARDVRERARDYGHYVQSKAHEATS